MNNTFLLFYFPQASESSMNFKYRKWSIDGLSRDPT